MPFLKSLKYPMNGLCSKCYSSGVSLKLDDETSEAL